MYELTQDMMEAAGLPAYEVSNHAAPGQESKHNLIYWRSHDWLGIGPGAHGRFDMRGERLATETYQSPRIWLNAVAEGNGESMRYALTKEDTATERTMMGLRLTEGLSHEAIKEYGKKISYLSEIGLLEIVAGQVFATRKGRMVLNSVLREILA